MKSLFITKDGDYGVVGTVAGVWEVDSTPAGSVTLFSQDGTNASTSGAAGSATANFTGTYFTISSNTPDGIMSSMKIDRSSFSYVKKAYAAPVKAVKFLGNTVTGSTGTYGDLNLPSTISVGDTVGVTIIDETKMPYDNSREKTYSFAVVTGDLLTGVTSKNIIAKLVTLINADANAVVVATAYTDGTDNDGLYCIAATAGNDFAIANVDGVLKDSDRCEYHIINDVYAATVTGTVANVVGYGTYAQIIKLQKDYDTRDGNTHTQKLTNYMYDHTSNAVAGQLYTTYFCKFRPVLDSPADRDSNYTQSVVIAVDTTATDMITDLDTLLAAANDTIN